MHSFDVQIAMKYGVDEAIFIHNLMFWIKKNEANREHFYDGHYWTYNTVSAYRELFPYWGDDKIKKMIARLEKKGVLKSGNFNTNTYDRTKWYTVADEAIVRIYSMHSAEWHDPLCHSAQSKEPNGTIITDINTNIKPDVNKENKKESSEFSELLEFFNQTNSVSLKETSSKKKSFQARRGRFSLDEIKQAIENRAKDEWAVREGWAKDWVSLFRNDEKIEFWLNKAPPNKSPPKYSLEWYQANGYTQ